jgi:hypothetical protein
MSDVDAGKIRVTEAQLGSKAGMRTRKIAALAALGLGVALASCGDDAKKAIGLGKNPPDEFQVLSRAPLSVPPEFTLRPPQPGAPRPQEPSLPDNVRQRVLNNSAPAAAPAPRDPAAPQASPRAPVAQAAIGAPAPASAPGQAFQPPQPIAATGAPSVGERVLLARVGADKTPPNIRQVVNEDTTRLAEADKQFLDRLLFWKKDEAPAVVIDAKKEQLRLQENAALGKPVNEGETPTIKRVRKGLLEGVF